MEDPRRPTLLQRLGVARLRGASGDPPPLSPAEVAARRRAYETLIGQHRPTLLAVARRLCGGGEDRAQDLVQEALVRGYEAYVQGRFQEGTNARAWLVRILTNGFLNDHNRRRRWEAGTDLDTLMADGAHVPAAMQSASVDRPEEALLAATLDEPLERALGRLSEELRACVVLVDMEGWEYAEAAQALGIPVGTVRSRLSRARLQLHALLYDYARERRRVE